MPRGLLAPFLLAASVAVVAATPSAKEQCTSEMNKIKDLLEVSCVDKGLTSIPSGLPDDTGILLLASNQLAKVALASFQHLPQLSDLDLSNNSLKALETGGTLPKLTQLLLSHNGLESLPAFPGLPSLRRLALGHNRLSQLPEGGFRALGQLDDLELQGNQLQNLPGGAFEGLRMLKDLDLSDNCLEALPPELLAELPMLEILRLERNRLERVPDGFFSGTEYGYIYLVENPWLCDCRLVYLRDWINDNEFFVYTRTTVEEDGLEKEVTENEPHQVLCQAPPEEKGKAVMNFQADCLAGDSWTPSPTPSASPLTERVAAPVPAQFLAASRRSSHSPRTAVSPTGAALTTTTTPALRSTMALSPTATSPGPTTVLNVLSTTAAFATPGLATSGATAGRSAATSKSPMTAPGPSTTHIPSAPTLRVPTPMVTSHTPLTLSTTTSMLTTPLPPRSGATVGRSAATSKGPMTAPGPSTTHIPSPPTLRVPTPMVTSHTPLTLSTTASMLTTPLPPRTLLPTTTAAGHPPSPAALGPSTLAPAQSSPRISAPLSTHEVSPPPPPKPSAHCLCPALPVRVLGVAARKGPNAEWLAGSCCLLRLALYLACLALVALPTLALLCWLGWLYLGWYRPALRGAPGSRLARHQQWQKASPTGWPLKLAEAPRPTSGPRIYRVCKKFQVAPSRHVTWLLVSLPGSAGKWAQMQSRLSSYSLDRGKDTLGAVRVRYAMDSL